jgi:hypothetical protein
MLRHFIYVNYVLWSPNHQSMVPEISVFKCKGNLTKRTLFKLKILLLTKIHNQNKYLIAIFFLAVC